ncbi:hypothetical protein JCM11641_000389 [Rhodosporidiobolus odoratus]
MPSRDKAKDRTNSQDASASKSTKVKPPNPSKRPLEATLLLPFQREILQQLVPPENAPPSTSDALLLIARGLGLRSVVTTFLKIYEMPEKLVLVVNATEEEERGFTEEVGMRLKAIGFETAEAQREKMYKDGGLFSVTSRILIVDMLKGVIPVHLITGLVVLHAEEVKPTSQEAFVVRIFKQHNKVGFIKAFSDRPEAFTFGLSPLQTTLMQLKLREVIIVPRFHDQVDADLQKRKADVIEFYQLLTHDMLDIQTAILECMEQTLGEIKRSNHYLEVDDLTVENALFSSFDRVVRTQLDPVWHKVGPKTRGLVFDLGTLRKLQDYLLSYDCVRFNTYLENLLSSHTPQLSGITSFSPKDRPAWLGTPAADTIFTVARNRVYLQKKVVEPPPDAADKGKGKARETSVTGEEIPDDLGEEDWMAMGSKGGENEEEEALLREMEEAEMRALAASSSSNSAPTASSSSSAVVAGGGAMLPPPLPSPFASTSTKQAPSPRPALDTPVPPKPKKPRWAPPGVEPVLEEQPKWLLLADVLDEIEGQMYWAEHDPYGLSNDTILVMCNSSETCLTLGEYLSSLQPTSSSAFPPPFSETDAAGAKRDKAFLERKLSSYFYWKAHMGRVQKSLKKTPGFNIQNNKGGRGSSGGSTATTTTATTPATAGGKGGGGGTAGSFAPSSRTSSSSSSSSLRGGGGGGGGEGELSAALKRKDFKRAGAPPTKRRRVRGGGAVGAIAGAGRAGTPAGDGGLGLAKGTGANPEALEEEVRRVSEIMGTSGATAPDALNDSTSLEGGAVEETFNETDFKEYFGLISNEDLVIIRPYLGDEDDRVLEELRPKFVVMFDPNPAFVRRIEAYRAAHQNLAIRVYFLVYKDSVEEQKYLSEIRKEKDAFVRLIQEKGSMAIPHEAEYRPEEQQEVLRTVSTRHGGKEATTEPSKVIVDLREFRSSLPGLLHAGRFEVVPVTLGIGDYILTPEMAVERKSIPDLIGSFNSGRLFQQCELMTAHYKQPILLIEFDEKKSFNLETYVESRPSSSSTEIDLRSKLVLLTISFPKLRIIWSSSPYQTVEIFRDLKDNRPEPDSSKAILVGLEQDSGGVAAEGTAAGYAAGEAALNLAPQEILRSLPGVSSKNYKYLGSQVDNLEELVGLPMGEIQALIGNEPGQRLFAFMHSDHFSVE